MAGLIKPSSGSITLDGKPIGKITPKQLARVLGLPPQILIQKKSGLRTVLEDSNNEFKKKAVRMIIHTAKIGVILFFNFSITSKSPQRSL